jgi:23S rRNA maturation mini-RNase III
MSRLAEVKSWMRWWGWRETDGAMLKRDINGFVIAHRGDAVWEADIAEAIAIEERLAEKYGRQS